MNIKRVYDEAGDWEALYIDNQLIQQGHSINFNDFIDYLKKEGVVTEYKGYEGDASLTGDWFPEDFENVKLVDNA